MLYTRCISSISYFPKAILFDYNNSEHSRTEILNKSRKAVKYLYQLLTL